jgi:RES domain-containing protein
MKFYRVCKQARAATAFDGEGARRFPGRWNEKGVALVYCASTLSLAALECLVHVEATTLPDDLVSIEASLPRGTHTKELLHGALPPDWRDYPAPAALQALGSAWVQGLESVALWVPSAVIPSERNLLINPAHPDFAKLPRAAPEPFRFDARLR